MSQQKWIVRLAAVVAVTAACSSEKAPEKLTVQGTVSQQLYAADVQAVAIGQDGRSFWAALDNKGDFKLVVPVGQSYRIVLAKPGPDGRSAAAVATLTLTGTTGGKTKWISARTAATLRLGDLVPAGTAAVASTGNTAGGGDLSTTIGTASRGSGRDGSGVVDETSGRGGSGRGGSGRGGDDGSSDDSEHDDFDDDQAHSDDPPCDEKDKGDSAICSAESTSEMECSRNSSDDVSESSDFSEHEDSTPACGGGGSTTTAPAEPSTETPASGGGGTSTAPSSP